MREGRFCSVVTPVTTNHWWGWFMKKLEHESKGRKNPGLQRPFISTGIMSGTSRDGIDVAVVAISGRFPMNEVELMHAETQAYPAWLRKRLMVPAEALTAEDTASLDFLLGEIYGKAVLKALAHAGLRPGDIDAIGSHGQTILHRPGGVKFGRRLIRSTLQVGSGAVIAQTAGIPTVADFRSADVAAGGQGAPLVPIFDYVVLHSSKKSRIALNIGGIANLTAIPRRAGLGDVLSFDTGPGNCLIDAAVRLLTDGRQTLDRDGSLARKGTPDPQEVKSVLRHPYFRRRPPKSTGWTEFGETYAHGIVRRMRRRRRLPADIVRTLTEATCESISRAIHSFVLPHKPVDEAVVTGGGSHNLVIMDGLRERLPGIMVDKGEAFGVPSDAKEAMAFAYLAYLHLNRIPANVISQNHNVRPAILGALYPA
jgi:anhydro-N-acetylmuramic acid kinase